jgi:diguanylate cyclase (GGDEF)-like protein
LSPHAIEVALQRPWWKLRLPPALEAAFEAETGPARCRRLFVYGLVGLLLYDAYLLTDLRLVPDIVDQAVLIRFGLVTPLFLAVLLGLRFEPRPALRESLQAGITVVITGSILWLTVASQSPTHVYRHLGILLVVLFANVVQRIRFWYATAASLASLAIYVAIVVQMQELPMVGRMAPIVVLANTVLFTLMANHTLERDTRREFLFRLQDRLRRDELEQMAQRDPLTGLGNRRHLDDALDRLWPEARARGESIAMLMLDIDAFKPFNDRYGHLAGDTCLQRVAAVVAAELRRPQDVVTRFGGEELAIVLCNMGLTEGVAVGERIRRAVEAVGIPHEVSSRGIVTASVGVAAGTPSADLAPHELLEAADTALYAAKRNGRNQVWPPLPGKHFDAAVTAQGRPKAKAG